MAYASYAAETRDTSHTLARAYRECALWLEHLEAEEKAPRSRIDYERSVAKLLRQNPDVAYDEFTEDHLLKTILSYPPGSRPPVRAHLTSFFKWGATRRPPLIPHNPMQWVPKPKGPNDLLLYSWRGAWGVVVIPPNARADQASDSVGTEPPR